MKKQILDRMFGEKKAPDGSWVADNFEKWFGKSTLVDSDGVPLVFHHGTGNLKSILKGGFSHDFTGKGNDQLGPGWYFTNRFDTAHGYTTRRMGDGAEKLGGDNSPGVLDVFLNLKNPIKTQEEHHWYDQLPSLNAHQARMFILEAPNIRDPGGILSNWGDLEEEGLDRVLRRAAQDYTGPSHFTISNDFFRDNSEAFLRTLAKITGHDGVVHSFSNGEQHVVAWKANQIKSVDLNNGFFDEKCGDLTDAKSPKVTALEKSIKRSKAAALLVEALETSTLKVSP